VSHKGSLPSFDWVTTVQSQNLQLSELARPKDALLLILLLTLDLREDSNKKLINITKVHNKKGYLWFNISVNEVPVPKKLECPSL
jgi:hypothetical protein